MSGEDTLALPANPEDLLSDNERERLAADLRAMAIQRRRAEVESRELVLG